MQVDYIDNRVVGTSSGFPREFIYKIDNTTLGPFDYSENEIKQFMNSVVEFRLNYSAITYIPYFNSDNFECFEWRITQIYNFGSRAHFVVSLLIERLSCTDLTNITWLDSFINHLIWINLLVIFLALFSLILTWKYIYKISKIYWRLKTKGKKGNKKKKDDDEDDKSGVRLRVTELQERTEKQEQAEENKQQEKKDDIYYNPLLDQNENKENCTWDQLISNDKRKFFNMWSLISLIGNIVQIFGSALSLFDSDIIMSSTEILIGIGCMLAYINIGRYLEYNRDYSTIFATIQRSLPNVLRYLLGVMPIFFGFIFFGLCLFWRSERFSDTSSTMITLFAMLNGDSVYDIFNDLTGISFFIGQIYCYIFCIMFIVVVMNVFISIIEEAYVSTKMKNQNHWIYSYLKIDPKYVEIKDIDEINKKMCEDVKPKKEETVPTPQDKVHKKLITDIKSKNILREIVHSDTNLKSQSEMTKKQQIENLLDGNFNNIDKSLNEIEKISTEISKSKDSNLKDELRLFIFDHLSSLENRIIQLREKWMQNI